jgi:predicted anti-sigma-YlaC factor YlaD
MRCTTIREALSARLDGEDPAVSDHDIDAHLGRCGDCATFALAAGVLDGVVERAPRDGVPLDPAVLASLTAPADDAAGGLLRTGEWRVVLAAITLVQMVVAWPGVLLHDGHASVHLAHELTAWDIGLAVGFLVAAVRPARAWGMLPLAAVLVAFMAGASALDVVSGHALLGREVVHVLELAGVGVLWVLARRVPRPSVVVRLA